ncbi:hypothetical protein CONLIGDRAFT_671258 [Coniochaeta ligniaria NRRL 30616]|uniref:2EXR domain-containing protein n=1 Tax=Coniochaeta ligniaria NRRL 30616 TaxID=1408157 RepID=A0A1J7JIM8_9PEZI|nr:hypothetical protein CONLIGDRAFT_671258 [Coniochaeta ligniaria NRRL 30616]
MADTESFTRFPNLPPELRIQIWTEALTVTSVWVAVLREPSNVHGGGTLRSRRSISMTCVGPSPHLVGLSCREARDVMERIYQRPLRGPIMEATSRGVHWIYLDKAVITFVNPQDSTAILGRFGAEISRFRHVALVWGSFCFYFHSCTRLAHSCPALRTIIVQHVELPENRPYSSTSTTQRYVADSPVLWELDTATAAHYAALLEYTTPEPGGTDAHIVRLRKAIFDCFGDSAPTLHVLAPDGTVFRSRAPPHLVSSTWRSRIIGAQ